MSDLFLDISEEFLSINFEGNYHITTIETPRFWEEPENVAIELTSFIADKGFTIEKVILTVPIQNINYQVVSLPESVEDSEKLVLLGLEIDPNQITQRFNYFQLPVTKREEDGNPICDYAVVSLKAGLYEIIEKFFKLSKLELSKVVPSFFLITPSRKNELTASAWVGHDRSEIVVWGKDNPLALSTAENTGDQMGDINRYISHYFDQFGGLNLSLVRLYGPRMRDESIAYSLAYESEILDEPRTIIAKSLPRAEACLDISQKIKLPRPPFEFNTRSITLLAFTALLVIFAGVASFFYMSNSGLNGDLTILRTEVDKNKKLLIKSKQLERRIKELGKEKDFYTSITKRRTPWAKISKELAELTPAGLWIERFNTSKASVQMSGKAISPESVSDFEINLNNSSKYFKDAQVIGVRDFIQEQRKYTEFQILVKLASPIEKK